MGWELLLSPLTPLYRGVIAARGLAYDHGWLPSFRLELPVISVGNLSFGGTGKTPLTIALVRDLVRRGRRPAVLTRGYGRAGSEPVVIIGPPSGLTPAETGDEPLEMASRLPGVPIVVHADRVAGGLLAQHHGADTLVLDDGFQHRRLARDLDLVVVDAGDPWAGGRLPPRGRLREPLSALARASAVIVSKLGGDAEERLAVIAEEVAAIAPQLPVLGARFAVKRVRLDGSWQDPGRLAGLRVMAFAGVGRPQSFVELLLAGGAEVVAERWFPDHHVYTQTELESVLEVARVENAVPVTTAKDAVKLSPELPVAVVEASMEPLAGSWDGLWTMLPGLLP